MDRYSPQVLYKNIGKTGQNKLLNKRAAIIGIGALGTVAAELLARAGVNLVVLDRDYVELSNLQRQSLFDETDIGKAKAEAAKQKLQKINSEIDIRSFAEELSPDNINKIEADVFLGCTDNMESRFLINEHCKKNNLPWIYGGAISDTGSLMVIKKKPCFRCVFSGISEDSCDTQGILNSASHIIASYMANEAIKVLLGKEHEKTLVYFDFWKNTIKKIKIKENKNCPVCSGRYEYITSDTKKITRFCTNVFQIRGKKQDLAKLEKSLSKKGKVLCFGSVLHFQDISIFSDGRAIIRAESKEKAKFIYDNLLS